MQRLCDWVKGRSINVSYIYIYIWDISMNWRNCYNFNEKTEFWDMRLEFLHFALVLMSAAIQYASSSVRFTSLKDGNGKYICATRMVLDSITIQTVSKIQCSLQCVQEKQCYFFNYFEDRNTCQMFSGSPYTRYTVVPNCLCYKVSRHFHQLFEMCCICISI